MPRTNLPHTQIAAAGIAPGAEVNADIANNHETVNDGKVFLLVRNSDAASQNTTFITPGTVGSLAVADRVVAIPAAASRYIGPFPTDVYGDVLQVDVTNANLRLTAYHL